MTFKYLITLSLALSAILEPTDDTDFTNHYPTGGAPAEDVPIADANYGANYKTLNVQVEAAEIEVRKLAEDKQDIIFDPQSDLGELAYSELLTAINYRTALLAKRSLVVSVMNPGPKRDPLEALVGKSKASLAAARELLARTSVEETEGLYPFRSHAADLKDANAEYVKTETGLRQPSLFGRAARFFGKARDNLAELDEELAAADKEVRRLNATKSYKILNQRWDDLRGFDASDLRTVRRYITAFALKTRFVIFRMPNSTSKAVAKSQVDKLVNSALSQVSSTEDIPKAPADPEDVFEDAVDVDDPEEGGLEAQKETGDDAAEAPKTEDVFEDAVDEKVELADAPKDGETVEEADVETGKKATETSPVEATGSSPPKAPEAPPANASEAPPANASGATPARVSPADASGASPPKVSPPKAAGLKTAEEVNKMTKDQEKAMNLESRNAKLLELENYIAGETAKLAGASDSEKLKILADIKTAEAAYRKLRGSPVMLWVILAVVAAASIGAGLFLYMRK